LSASRPRTNREKHLLLLLLLLLHNTHHIKVQLLCLSPIIDIPISSPSPKRTRKTRKKLPSGIFLVSRATKPDCSSLWQHIAVEKNQTMVVAGSVNFLMKRREETKLGSVADEEILCTVLS
jgi:hypothetical protein